MMRAGGDRPDGSNAGEDSAGDGTIPAGIHAGRPESLASKEDALVEEHPSTKRDGDVAEYAGLVKGRSLSDDWFDLRDCAPHAQAGRRGGVSAPITQSDCRPERRVRDR